MTDALLDERQKTHGSFARNAAIGQKLREMFRNSEGWYMATDRQREALDYIAGKLARILSGKPGHADHWDDIAGYATLVAKNLPRPRAVGAETVPGCTRSI